MELLDKLTILADAAKYDAACTSSGWTGPGGRDSWVLPRWRLLPLLSADGRCVTLLKVLMTNVCAYDCQYCVNRRSNDVPRAAFTPRSWPSSPSNFIAATTSKGFSSPPR